MATPKRINYLSNSYLLPEIAKSKNSYSVYSDDMFANYDIIIKPDDGQTVSDALHTHDLALGTIARVHTFEHVPLDPERKPKNREINKTHAYCQFPPFQHWRLSEEGWVCVGKSHWKGGLENGHFSNDHGRISNGLGNSLMLLVDRYGNRGNWRGYSYNDEMRGLALVQLCQVALQFDESRTQNAFSYYTAIVTNCFTRVLNNEKKQQMIRDDLLIQSGAAPSMTRQVEHELARMGGNEPAPMVRKRGRPKKSTTAS